MGRQNHLNIPKSSSEKNPPSACFGVKYEVLFVVGEAQKMVKRAVAIAAAPASGPVQLGHVPTGFEPQKCGKWQCAK